MQKIHNKNTMIAFYPLSMDGKSWQITKEFILIKMGGAACEEFYGKPTLW